jgi:TolA-binding protein
MKKVFVSLAVGLTMVCITLADQHSAYSNAYATYRSGDYVGAQTAYANILKDYPDAGVNILSKAQLGIGYSLSAQKQYDEAIVALSLVKENYPTAPVSRLATADFTIASILVRQRKLSEANVAYVNLVKDYAWQLGAKSEKSVVWISFERINPKLLNTEDYKAFLEEIVKSVKATEENAKFLGRVKSELEKMK